MTAVMRELAVEIAPSSAQLAYYRALATKDPLAIVRAENLMLAWARLQLSRMPEYARNRAALDQMLSDKCPDGVREQVVGMIARIRFNEAADPTGGRFA